VLSALCQTVPGAGPQEPSELSPVLPSSDGQCPVSQCDCASAPPPPAQTSRGSLAQAWKERREGRQRRVRRQEGNPKSRSSVKSPPTPSLAGGRQAAPLTGEGGGSKGVRFAALLRGLFVSRSAAARVLPSASACTWTIPSFLWPLACQRLAQTGRGTKRGTSVNCTAEQLARLHMANRQEQPVTAAACFGQSRCRKSDPAVWFCVRRRFPQPNARGAFEKWVVALVW
jgi:hypothetical protein